jgi:hypothetical protein
MMTTQLSGSWLKVIAILSMTIDHIAYYYGVSNPYVYELMRTVGRIAFPTFAFLLAEGYVYTRNRQRYMLSLFTFAILSEIPWILLNHDNSHNVLFTLLAGVIGMYIIDTSRNKWVTLTSLVLIGCTTLMTETDYSLNGYVLTLLFFMFRGRPDLHMLFGLPLMYEYGFMGILMAFAVIFLYNGERGFIHGKAAKYAFYAFYPAHLMLIYLIR